MAEPFETFIAREVFAELGGFVLSDPGELDRHHGGSASGLDLLELYGTSDEGDAVAAGGLAIPVLGLEAGYYTLVVRGAEATAHLTGPPRLVSSGWVLHVVSDRLCLSGAGYLKRWDPNGPRILHPVVPAGWYEVEVRCGFGGVDGEEPVIEFVLRAATDRPCFAADPSADFDFTSTA